MSRTLRVLASLTLVVIFAAGGGNENELVEPVSMYLADNTLYVSDPYSGVHMFDALPGRPPVPQGVVPFRGNTGVAVYEDVVYANSGQGIFALRIIGAGLVDTLAGPFGAPVSYMAWDEGPFDGDGWGCGGCTSTQYDMAPASPSGGSSYAVFAVIDTFLYYADVSQGSVVAMTIAHPESPRVLGKTQVTWDLETLHPQGRYLFLGSRTGMHILDRDPDPVHLAYKGRFEHVRACDPVVVQGSLAYVTVRSGATCGMTEDALLVVSIADPSLPQLLCSATPPTPYGLAVQDSYVYVGNGNQGLSLYQAGESDCVSLVTRWPWKARDFIWSGSMLYVLEPAGLSAYDVSDPRHPVLLKADS